MDGIWTGEFFDVFNEYLWAQVIGSCREPSNEYNGVLVLEFMWWWGNGLRPGEYYGEKDNQVQTNR